MFSTLGINNLGTIKSSQFIWQTLLQLLLGYWFYYKALIIYTSWYPSATKSPSNTAKTTGNQSFAVSLDGAIWFGGCSLHVFLGDCFSFSSFSSKN